MSVEHAAFDCAYTGDDDRCEPCDGQGLPHAKRAAGVRRPYLFIFATGTGIAPIKALIESGDLQVATPSFFDIVPQAPFCVTQFVVC